MEGDAIPGHVGMPSPCVDIKLVDVPELGYFAKDEAGEVSGARGKIQIQII